MTKIESLYQIYYSQVYNYVFFRIMNKEITEDIVGDVFTKIISRYESYDSSKSGLSTWIFTIAKNTLIDYYRSEKYEKFEYNDDYENLESLKSANFTDSQDIRYNVLKVLKKLNEIDRTVIFLRYYSDLPYKEISEHVGYSPRHVGVILNRALKKFKNNYEKEGNYNEFRKS